MDVPVFMNFSVFVYVFGSGVATCLDTRDQQHPTLARDTHPCPCENSNPQPQQVSGRRHHWDRHYYLLETEIPILSPICRPLDYCCPGPPHHSPHPGYTPGIYITKMNTHFIAHLPPPGLLLPGVATPFTPPWLHPWYLHHENESSSFEPWLLCADTKVSL